MNISRTGVVACVTAAVVVVAISALASVAVAAPGFRKQCSPKEAEKYVLPGNRDVMVWHRACIGWWPGRGRSTQQAWVYTWWYRPGSGGEPIWRRTYKPFDRFVVQARLERWNPRGRDVVIQGAKQPCSLTDNRGDNINSVRDGRDVCRTKAITVRNSRMRYPRLKNATGDGTIFYNFNRDDRGTMKWYLHGSPPL